MDVTIVGGGIAGLYMAYRLLCLDSNIDIKIFEKKSSFGGKIHTVYDTNGHVQMEGGPWRILKNHSLMHKLCSTLDCPLIKIKHTNIHTYSKINHKNGALSTFDLELLSKGQLCAFQAEMSTGYNESMNKNSLFPLLFPTEYYVLQKGFNHLIHQLLSKLPQSILHTNTMITDIEKTSNGYIITYMKRLKNRFRIYYHHTRKIILACPPEYMHSWSIYKHLDVLASCVETRSLNHMYCKFINQPIELRNCYYKTDNVLNQIISSNYGNQWCQVSYTSGRIADFWNRLYLLDQLRCKDFVEKNLMSIFSFTNRPIIEEIRSFYFENAVHQWKAGYGFDKDRMFYTALYPHPIKLPNLYIIGESFSRQQGWIEGALETVNTLLDNKFSHLISPQLPIEWIIFDDRVIDVKEWKKRHPGSEEAIKNHLYEDVTKLWKHIHNSLQSKMILMYNQTAWYHNNMYKLFYKHKKLTYS